jgi:hypothetical protein
MRDLLNIIDNLVSEATLSASQITKYPERFDAFISHIQDGRPFYTEKDGTEVILKKSEANRFLQMKQQGLFKGTVQGQDEEGNMWPLSGFRKTGEFGGASAKPGADPADVKKEGAQLKPSQIGIADQDIPAGQLGEMIVNNSVLQSTDYGKAVIGMAQNIMTGNPAVIPPEFVKQDQIKKAINDYAGEYLGVLALIYNQTKFPKRDEFLGWLGGDLQDLVLRFPSEVSNPLADSFATITSLENNHTLSISSKGKGGGAPPSMSSLKVPDHIRNKPEYQTAIDIIELTQNENLPKPKTVSQVFQIMNLLWERMPKKIPKDFMPFLPWDMNIVAQVNDSRKNGTPMPEYEPLFANLDSKGSDGGKLTYVVKQAVMNMINKDNAVPEFQAAVLEILDYNFIQQYATISRGTMLFETQWPAKLDGKVTVESKSGGTDPTKGGLSFKLSPKGAPDPSMEPMDADSAAVGAETAYLDTDDLDKVTQQPRLKGPGVKAAKAPEPKLDKATLGREKRRR